MVDEGITDDQESITESITHDDLLAEMAEWIVGPPEPSRDDGWITIRDIVEFTGVQRKTVAGRCVILVDNGKLEVVKHLGRNYYRKVSDG